MARLLDHAITSPALSALVCALVSCSSSDTGGAAATTGDASDGRYHPEPNNVHVAEAQACDALIAAQEKAHQKFEGCANTSRTCPSLLRAEFKTACMEYDQGSVQGCVDYYDEAETCDAVRARVADCVITPYPGTEPAGCP